MNLRNNEGNPDWYAIYTRPRSEKKVYQRMLDQGIEAFLPMFRTIRQWSDRKKIVEVPLISSYVFVNMQEKDLYQTLPIQGTVNVLKHLGKPARIRAVEIENLRILSSTDENHQIENCINLEIGDDVEVINGPFMGLMASCVQEDHKHRVVVKIDSLGSCFKVNIPLSFLRKIDKRETIKI